jgi:hypothetical protein
MPDKLIPLCGLYENVSKQTGKRYFTGTLSYTSKLLIFANDDAKEGEPQWQVFLAEREAKPKPAGDRGVVTGDIPQSDFPPRRWTRKTP